MTVIEKLKAKAMELRKARNPSAASVVFAISEIEKIGKNGGNRETTDDEAIKVVQKLVATAEQNYDLAKDDGRKIAYGFEKQILNSVLPQMVSDSETSTFISLTVTQLRKTQEKINKGDVLKAVRTQFGARVDMKRAGQILQEVYGI